MRAAHAWGSNHHLRRGVRRAGAGPSRVPPEAARGGLNDARWWPVGLGIPIYAAGDSGGNRGIKRRPLPTLSGVDPRLCPPFGGQSLGLAACAAAHPKRDRARPTVERTVTPDPPRPLFGRDSRQGRLHRTPHDSRAIEVTERCLGRLSPRPGGCGLRSERRHPRGETQAALHPAACRTDLPRQIAAAPPLRAQ